MVYIRYCCYLFFFDGYGDHRDLHVLTHSFPTRRSSDLVNAFLNNDVLAAADPYLEPGVDPSRLTVAAVLAHAGTRLDSNSIHNPAARARIGLTLGRAWFGLGVWDKARMRLEAALADPLGTGRAHV